jgi:hypothetical protein
VKRGRGRQKTHEPANNSHVLEMTTTNNYFVDLMTDFCIVANLHTRPISRIAKALELTQFLNNKDLFVDYVLKKVIYWCACDNLDSLNYIRENFKNVYDGIINDQHNIPDFCAAFPAIDDLCKKQIEIIKSKF